MSVFGNLSMHIGVLKLVMLAGQIAVLISRIYSGSLQPVVHSQSVTAEKSPLEAR